MKEKKKRTRRKKLDLREGLETSTPAPRLISWHDSLGLIVSLYCPVCKDLGYFGFNGTAINPLTEPWDRPVAPWECEKCRV